MSERFIAMSGDGLYGHYGVGETIDMAQRKLRAAGGRSKGCVVFHFTSMMPFAPFYRDAHDNEADCWVGQDGALNWIRCEREKLNS